MSSGMKLRDVARFYSAKSAATQDQHIKDYLMHKPKDKHSFSGRFLVPLRRIQNTTDDKSFLNVLIKKAKETPSCQKYSKILKWSDDDRRKSGLPRSDKISIFTEVAAKAKGKPGPHHYPNAVKAKETTLRSTTGFFSR